MIEYILYRLFVSKCLDTSGTSVYEYYDLDSGYAQGFRAYCEPLYN